MTWLGRRYRLVEASSAAETSAAATGDAPDALTAPMPGRIARIHVTEGDRVRQNAPLVILEAMKMEHAVKTARAGRVARVLVREGDPVDAGAALVAIDVDPDPASSEAAS